MTLLIENFDKTKKSFFKAVIVSSLLINHKRVTHNVFYLIVFIIRLHINVRNNSLKKVNNRKGFK